MNKLLITFLLAVTTTAFAQDIGNAYKTKELRYCGVPTRDAKGSVTRSASVLAAFQKAHPCPSTGSTAGACPGWVIDHVIPRAAGGCDAVSNLQWSPDADSKNKDNYECKIYGNPAVYNNPNCKLALPIK